MAIDESLLKPIPGDNPSGPTLRYDPLWDRIREARREDDALPQGIWERPRKTAEHDLVIRLTAEALETRSKDLYLAAWRTEALLRRVGIPGLTNGLELNRALLEQFWDSVHPEIEDESDLGFRAAPLEWMGTKLGDHVRRVPVTARKLDWYAYRESRSVPAETAEESAASKRAEALSEGKTAPEVFDAAVQATPKTFYESLVSDLDAALSALRELDAVCSERFYDGVDFRPLREALTEVRELAHMLLQKKREYEPDFTPTEEAIPGAAEPPAPATLESVLAYAAWARTERPSSPVPYLLVRAVRWGELRENGGQPGDVLPAPTREARERLAGAARESRWGALLEMTEVEMETPAGRGWLDLQRYACLACEELGQTYSGVRRAIAAETLALLSRFPRLPRASLSDGTPAADAATLEWLRKAVSEQPATDGELAPAASGRTRFVERLQLAKECLKTGQQSVGVALLEELVEEADRRSLDEWESPDLVVEPFVLLLDLLDAEADKERCRAVFNRICRMHPRLAMDRRLQGPYA